MKERIEELETRCNELFFQCNKQNEQLTQATELLERLVTVCKIVPLGTNYDVVKKAEQFIKDLKK